MVFVIFFSYHFKMTFLHQQDETFWEEADAGASNQLIGNDCIEDPDQLNNPLIVSYH